MHPASAVIACRLVCLAVWRLLVRMDTSPDRKDQGSCSVAICPFLADAFAYSAVNTSLFHQVITRIHFIVADTMGAATTASRPQGQAPRATMNGTNGTLNGLQTNGLSKAQKTSSPIRKSPATNAVKSPASAPSAYSIMAERIANRVAEMAESITFVERYVRSRAKDTVSNWAAFTDRA